MRQKLKKIWKEYKSLLVFIILMICFRSALADWNPVPTGSMKPNIIEGDRVFVNKIAYDLRIPLTAISLKRLADPQRCDIVTFDSKSADETLIKRVIGLPGDTVQMVNNHLIINGEVADYRILSEDGEKLLVEETIGDNTHFIKVSKDFSYYGNFGPVIVPEDAYLVLGDNREDSADSRQHGFVPRSEIRGRSRKIVLSLNYDNYYLPRKSRFLKDLL